MEIWNWISETFCDVLRSFGLLYKKGNLVLLGLDNAGKTTLMGVLKNNILKQNTSTQYATKEDLVIGDIKFACFDVGGHVEVRYMWKNYFPTVSAIVFIVDAADQERILEAKQEIDKVLSNSDVKDVPIVIFGNKIDRHTAVSEEELRSQLGVPTSLTTGKKTTRSELRSKGIRPVEVFMCSIVMRQGYGEGFKWLSQYID